MTMAKTSITQEHRQIAISTPLGPNTFLVRRMTISEALGAPFECEIDLTSEESEIAFDDLIGKNVTVRLELSDRQTRYFNGYVSQFQQTAREEGLTEYHAVVVPWLWFLTRTSDCRIFQEKDVPTIIKEVFRQHGFTDFEEQLSGAYRTWEYCVQYRETDFNFVSRLMEQEGIYYYFKHENGKHTLVLADSPTSHSTYPGYEQIEYHQPDEIIADREFITSWKVNQSIQPGVFELKDFDFKNPSDPLESKSIAEVAHEQGKFGVFDFPGEYETSGDGDMYARIRQEEVHACRVSVSCESDCRGIAVGSKFKIINAPRRDLGDEFLVISANYYLESEHAVSGSPGGGLPYTVSFIAIPAQRQFRPGRQTPKPLIQGPQTAIVAGKSGEEIWTDEHGRVKLQFHWDRYSRGDENSSCWVRVSQNWAGKRWGAFFLPRVGQEVIVEFLEGDPDRPIITGRVYNGQNMPPYKPQEMGTISTIKSNSSKGGGGFNEIRFEDKKDEEQLFIHAQKNMDIRVLNDRFETVMHDRHLVVGNDKHEHVKNDRDELVDANHREKIGADRSLKVEGKEAKHVAGEQSLTVDADVHEVFHANQSTEVTAKATLKADIIVLEGATNVTLKVGDSFVAITSDGVKIGTNGQIVLEAQSDLTASSSTGNVALEASLGELSATGMSAASLSSSGQTSIEGTMVSVSGDAMTEIRGGLVQIN
ncbi:MAG: type VI secretion system tip protein VgrG [Planctomycetota bacterium]|nr:MAG: type VI secretion system tip protein VgrG [Planctomycetota bacterium]